MKIINRTLHALALGGILILTIASTSSDESKYFEISKNIEIFTNLYKEINTYYVDDLDPSQLMRTGIDAMLESLDPYTNYISETEIEGFRFITDGKYNGIGALIEKHGDDVTVTEPYEGSPALKAGLKAGDVILAIDGKSTEKRSTEDISNILKGFPGTDVVLTIRRPGADKTMDLTLTRDEVIVPNVPYQGMVSDGIGYFALTTFTREAGKNVGNALKKLQEEDPNLKGVVFDLRGNGGGLLTEAVNVSNVFIPKNELVVTTKGKVMDWDRSFKTMKNPVDEAIPVVVLIDDGSASASEIVSGVLQDLDRAVLLGQRSYGKGLVQNTRDVGYNSKVKLTTAKYYIPSGRCIQGVNYEDGRPITVADSLRTTFYTKNKRPVKDGGGVSPDVLLDKPSLTSLVRSLQKKHLIFDYVTQWALDHPEIQEPEAFRFTEFDDFLQFVEDQGFDYNSQSEKALELLRKRAREDAYLKAISTDIAVIEQKINDAKKQELMNHQEEIIDLLEKEIVGRYYYETGKIKVRLRNDEEIKEAITLLKDQNKYQEILKVKK